MPIKPDASSASIHRSRLMCLCALFTTGVLSIGCGGGSSSSAPPVITTPTITWATPAAIVYGTALSYSAQLDATANVDGTFVYSPAAGTVEPVGNNTLSVTFTPNDTKDYTNATDTVSLTVTSNSNSSSVTTLSLIQQMANLDGLAEFPVGTTNGIVDSDDPRKLPPSGSTMPTCFYCDVDGGNFFGDMTIDGVLQHVMLNVDGPGVMTRLEALGPNFSGHTLRVFLDNSTTPAIQADLQALLTGNTKYISASPLIFQGGTTITSVLGSGVPTPGLSMYLPIPYAKHILVTYDGPDNINVMSQPGPILDWIIEYKGLPTSTNVTTYSLADYNNNLPAITSALNKLSPFALTPSAAPGPFSDADATSIFNGSIAPGASTSVTLPSSSNAIRFLSTNLGSAATTLNGLTVSITFDGEQTVDAVPVGDFFGAGNGTQSGIGSNDGSTMTQSVVSDGTLTTRWTMPYQSSASITLRNTTSSAINVNLLADIAAYPWDSESMHFHAFRRVNGPFMTTNDFTSRFLFVKGSGVYVGDNETVYQAQSGGDTAYNWFGEGDEMFYVDDSLFPERGTGTEDYYDFAYGNPSYFQSPWASQVAFAPQTPGETQYYYDGTTVFNRTRLLDTIPFSSSLRFDFEINDHDQSVNNTLQLDHTAFFMLYPEQSLNRTLWSLDQRTPFNLMSRVGTSTQAEVVSRRSTSPRTTRRSSFSLKTVATGTSKMSPPASTSVSRAI